MRRRVTISLFGLTAVLGACGGGDDDSSASADAAIDAPPIVVDAAEPDAFVPANCDSLSKPTTIATHLSHVPASEDFGFDNEGFLIGVTIGVGDLVRTAYQPGPPEVVALGVSSEGFARGTRQLPGGDIVVAVPERNVVERYTGGSGVRIAQIGDPNGIVIGDDGMVYVTAGTGSVTRIDPDTEDTVTLHTAGSSFDGITMSPDGTTLYFNSEGGQVQELEIDENGAVGVPQPTTDIAVDFLLDGMTTDACGNIYIVEMAGKIWRYSTAGVLEEWVAPTQLNPRPQLIPAVNFGSGKGGWKDTALYIMSFDGGVFEIDIGVVGRPTANNR